MLNDFKKSILLVLQERITSPFSGAFFFSWFVWNWKMLYFLFFANEALTLSDRFAFVDTHFLNWKENLILPFISTLFFVGLYPFITTGALWFWLKFKKWQTDIKNDIEGQQLLTLEQSVALRLEIEGQHERLNRLTKSKDDEITLLKRENQELKMRLSQTSNSDNLRIPEVIPVTDKFQTETNDFLKNTRAINHFPEVIRTIQGNYKFNDDFDSNVLGYLIGNDIITKKPNGSTYEFTEKGKAFLRAFTSK